VIKITPKYKYIRYNQDIRKQGSGLMANNFESVPTHNLAEDEVAKAAIALAEHLASDPDYIEKHIDQQWERLSPEKRSFLMAAINRNTMEQDLSQREASTKLAVAMLYELVDVVAIDHEVEAMEGQFTPPIHAA
jgi:hypothetical protein